MASFWEMVKNEGWLEDGLTSFPLLEEQVTRNRKIIIPSEKNTDSLTLLQTSLGNPPKSSHSSLPKKTPCFVIS